MSKEYLSNRTDVEGELSGYYQNSIASTMALEEVARKVACDMFGV